MKETVMSIQKDASDAWNTEQAYAVQKFSDDSAQMATDFQTRLAAIGHEHKDLRDALSAIIGPVTVDDFDRNFDKYIQLAQAKMQPPAPAATPSTDAAPAVSTPQPTPAQSPTASGEPDASLEAKLDDLSSKLREQKQSLDAIRTQAQALDDNYPVLHHELGSQIEKLRSDIFWLRLILVIVGAGMFVGIGIGLLALDRASGPAAKKNGMHDTKKKRDPQVPGEEPMKAILGRLYKLEQDINDLRMQIPAGENATRTDLRDDH